MSIMSKDTALKKITTLSKTIKTLKLKDCQLVEAFIAGILFVVFDKEQKDKYSFYFNLKDGKNVIDREIFNSFEKGIYEAKNCRRGPRKKNTVILNSMAVPTELKKQLEVIKKQKKFRHLNDVRKAAYNYYIVSELNK